jgi:type II secretory pathway pseudopilin PulG
VSAVTLLEMTLTLALVALAATVVAPRLVHRDGGSLSAAAETCAERLTAARWQALVEGHTVEVAFDALAPGLRVSEEVSGGSPRSPARGIVFAPVPTALPRTIALTDGAGRTARITIPAGLGSLAVVLEERS